MITQDGKNPTAAYTAMPKTIPSPPFACPAINPMTGEHFRVIQRLKEGIERYFITDINNPAASNLGQSRLPVMMDYWAGWNDEENVVAVAAFNHVPGGSNVLYMDGHVAFCRYGVYPKGEFPCQDENLITFGGTLGNMLARVGGGL